MGLRKPPLSSLRGNPMRIARAAGPLAFGLAALVATTCLADTLRGTLRSVEPRSRRIVVTDADGDDNHLVVARTARVSLNGRPAALSDLRRGDRVVVAFTEDPNGNAIATAVAATRAQGG